MTSLTTALVTLLIGRDIDRVHLGQEALDLAHRYAACVHGDDLVVKAGEAALMLANELRLERALAVAGNGTDGYFVSIRTRHR